MPALGVIAMLKPLVSTNPLAKLAKSAIYCEFELSQDKERSQVKKSMEDKGYTLLSELSHLGGNPLLPKDFVWPCAAYSDNEQDAQDKMRPLVFSLQVDLSELAPFDVDNQLPHKGLMVIFTVGNFFYWDEYENQSKVYIFEDIDSLVETSRPSEPPVGHDYDASDLVLPHCLMGIKATWSVPEEYSNILDEDEETFSDGVNAFGLSQEQVHDINANYEDYYKELMEKDGLAEKDDVPSQFLGWGQYIQGDYVGSNNETLFFTLSSFFDENIKEWPLCIGDAGAIYHFIDLADLKAKNFSDIRSTMDCY